MYQNSMAPALELDPAAEYKMQDLYMRGLGEKEIEGCIPELAQFVPAIQVEILQKFEEADWSDLKNKEGFLRGIIKRFQSRPPLRHTEAPAVHVELAPVAQEVLDELYASGQVVYGELDATVLTNIASLPLDRQMEILEKFSEANLKTVHKKSNFLAGIVRRYAADLLTTTQPSAVPELAPAAQAILSQMIAEGRVGSLELQPSSLAQVASLAPQVQSTVMQKFCEADLAPIKSKSGFLQGIVKRFAQPVTHPAGIPIVTAVGQRNPILPYTGATSTHHDKGWFPPYWTTCPPAFSGLSPTFEALFQRGYLSPNDIDYEMARDMSALSPNTVHAILEKYSEANLAEVKSRKGFLKGIIKRYRDMNVAEDTGVKPGSKFSELPFSVQVKLDTLVSAGLLNWVDLSEKCYEELGKHDEQTAVGFLTKLQNADLPQIRNKSTYLLGIISGQKKSGGPVPKSTGLSRHRIQPY